MLLVLFKSKAYLHLRGITISSSAQRIQRSISIDFSQNQKVCFCGFAAIINISEIFVYQSSHIILRESVLHLKYECGFFKLLSWNCGFSNSQMRNHLFRGHKRKADIWNWLLRLLRLHSMYPLNAIWTMWKRYSVLNSVIPAIRHTRFNFDLPRSFSTIFKNTSFIESVWCNQRNRNL